MSLRLPAFLAYILLVLATSAVYIPSPDNSQDVSNKQFELLLSQLEQDDPDCRDVAKNYLCDRLKNVHKACDSRKDLAEQYCKSTCGLCPDNGKGPSPTRLPTKPTVPPQTGGCESSPGGCCGDMRTPAVQGRPCSIDLGCPDAMAAFNLHNELRNQHGSPPLKWDEQLYQEAMEWAREEARTNTMYHSGKEGEGENLAYFWMQPDPATEATRVWYDEVKDYSYNSPESCWGCLHFTQLVWKSTTHVGIGCAKTQDGLYTHVVARYTPKGNWGGEFTENVLQYP